MRRFVVFNWLPFLSQQRAIDYTTVELARFRVRFEKTGKAEILNRMRKGARARWR